MEPLSTKAEIDGLRQVVSFEPDESLPFEVSRQLLDGSKEVGGLLLAAGGRSDETHLAPGGMRAFRGH